MEYIDKVGLLTFKDKRVLMALSHGKDKFYMPGGKRDGQESDVDCLSREIKEELAVEINKESLKYYGTFEDQAHGKPPGVLIRMICYTGDLMSEPSASSEIEKLEYLPYSRKLDTGTVAHKIFDDLKLKGLIE